jgi:hypothetical protein
MAGARGFALDDGTRSHTGYLKSQPISFHYILIINHPARPALQAAMDYALRSGKVQSRRPCAATISSSAARSANNDEMKNGTCGP